MTYWYEIPSPAGLAPLTELLHPGSRTSFYFDDRLRFRAVNESFINDYLRWGPEAVVGLRTDYELEFDVDFCTGLDELREFLGPHYSDSSEVLLGTYPAADDDGVDAVTLLLPDADGQVRAHPH